MCYQMTAESGPFTYDILQLARENNMIHWISELDARNQSTAISGTGCRKLLRLGSTAHEKRTFLRRLPMGNVTDSAFL